ncbi:MAG: GxGYxYP domain-containing protein, partial [Bacteroidota bacterium]
MKPTKYLSQFLIIAACLLVALVGCAPQEDPAEAQIAYKMKLSGDWKIDGDLPTKAMLISLQGIANANEPMFYLVYPEGWPYNYT